MLGKTVKERREALGMRQQDLSNAAGVGIRTIAAIENGDTDVRLSTLLKLAGVLGPEIITVAIGSGNPATARYLTQAGWPMPDESIELAAASA